MSIGVFGVSINEDCVLGYFGWGCFRKAYAPARQRKACALSHVQKSLRAGSALFFPRDFAAQKARYPRDEFFLPSLKRAPGAVSLCGFPTRRRQKKPITRRSSLCSEKSVPLRRSGFHHLCAIFIKKL
jgi:hypothetical protein